MPWVHDVDPVAFHVGSVPVAWYGLMYLAGYLLALSLGLWRVRQGRFPPGPSAFLDLLFAAMLGVILGARVGHLLLYEPLQWMSEPLLLLRLREGGMSFHGGAMGVLAATWLWSRRYRAAFGDALDFLVPLAPLGIGCGRLGNWINGELWGTPTDVPWGVIFPAAGDAIARHPSQLYELVLEGPLLFAILWTLASRPQRRWVLSGVFTLGYAALRLVAECFRAPEPGVASAIEGLTYGQVLTLPMVALGALLLLRARFAVRANP
jgi:phosphatidylglycerol---prolipoprotein diacylglyceryl transferase